MHFALSGICRTRYSGGPSRARVRAASLPTLLFHSLAAFPFSFRDDGGESSKGLRGGSDDQSKTAAAIAASSVAPLRAERWRGGRGEGPRERQPWR